MAASDSITVIIPTTGVSRRRELLRRAIDSVLQQEGVQGIPLVVLNGQEADPDLQEMLLNDTRLRVVQRREASLPEAILAGRKAVETPWFAELDDDDLLLPGALSLRIEALRTDPAADVVVTNGYRREERGDILHVRDMRQVERDPVRALIQQNWLLPGSWAARTDRVGSAIFEEIPRCRECTYLALMFSTRFATLFRPEPTVVWDTTTPGSMAKSLDYILSGPPALRRFARMDLPGDVRAEYRRRLADSYHEATRWYMDGGQFGRAWRQHLASLLSPGGRKYLRHTARLLLPSKKR